MISNYNYTSVNNNVTVKQDDERKVSSSGFIIGGIINSNHLKPNTGTVISCPPNCGINIGDRIFFGKYSGVNAYIKGDHVVIMKYNEVLGVMK